MRDDAHVEGVVTVPRMRHLDVGCAADRLGEVPEVKLPQLSVALRIAAGLCDGAASRDALLALAETIDHFLGVPELEAAVDAEIAALDALWLL